ncbi:MAG: hypothetical protein AB1489_40050, partial [Acidobacteriota bacterium]
KHQKKSLEKSFRRMLNEGKLFKPIASVPFVSPVQSCVATPYLDLKPWQPGYIKLGEAAFALDPLSSSGVEKAMRFTLQAVIAANTLLQNQAMTELAQEFYESRLLESVATHTIWTQNYYKLAWPGDNYEFWRRRSQPIAILDKDSDFVVRLQEACAISEKQQVNDQRQPQLDTSFEIASISNETMHAFLQSPVTLSPEINFIQMPCVVDDQIQLCFAVIHPALARPVAFLENLRLVPLLQFVPMAGNLNQLIRVWSTQMPLPTAIRIANWLIKHGMLSISQRLASLTRANAPDIS